MTDSILNTIKQMIGGAAAHDTVFDVDIITHINTAFMTLAQIGIGPSTGFRIKDDLYVWSDVIADERNLESVKSYIYIKVKLLFDPPASASIAETLKQQASEIEWRLSVEAESSGSTDKPMDDGWCLLAVRR